VSAGLWPVPEKGPLNARVFGRIERSDYSIEKVFFESHPGFYVTGNLYRPVGKTGPFPGVLSPHGHWAYGRLENGADGSIPARGISLARQGYVVFSYDMVGYNDSRQVDHRLFDPRLAQWGIGRSGCTSGQHPLGGLPGVAARRGQGSPCRHGAPRVGARRPSC